MRITGPAVICSFLFITSCTDANQALPTEPLTGAASLAHMAQTSGQEAPEGVPPEYQVPSVLNSVVADAGWRYGNAFASGIIDFVATNALLRVTVYAAGTSVEHEEQIFNYLPIHRVYQLKDDPEIPMPVCQGTIRGSAYGRIWNEFVGLGSLLRWGEQVGSDTKYYECPPPPSSAPSGGSDERRCYTVDIDYYLYDPNTGTVEYLYTESYTVCQESGQYVA